MQHGPECHVPDPKSSLSGDAGERRTLLVVDDEEGPRRSLRLIFEDQYAVLLAESGHRAVELARKRPIDAAVLDIRMAGMSGVEVLGQLKQIDPQVEVIMLTAYAALDSARQAIRLGACDYLTKPFDLPTLRAAVSRMMDRRRLSEQTLANLLRLSALAQEIKALQARGEKLQSRNEIYGSILHDISGPLTVVVGIVSLLNRQLGELQRLEGEDMAQFRARLRAVNSQTDNIINVVQRYLGLLRNDPGGKSILSVNQVLADLRVLLKVYPAAQDCEIAFLLLLDDAQVEANGTDLLQILLNLTLNALQAVPRPSRVEVAACASEAVPNGELWRDGPTRRFVRAADFDGKGPFVVFSVRDDGPGIAPEIVARIFDSAVTTKPAGLGTGLGLMIVKRLVFVSKGALALETQPGEGTTLTIFLPAARHTGQ
jgi:signal transduction histidine kinase